MDGIAVTRLLHLGRLKSHSDNPPMQNSVASIYSQKNFRLFLAREKARADRNGHGFSLVAIEISNLANIQTLVGRFQKLIRTTDEIGWFDHNTLGIFLYNTSAIGAWQFLNNTKKTDGDSISKYLVYSYPNEWCGL
jgi:hypothetical protein